MPPEPDASDYAQSVAKLGLAVVAVHYPHLAPLLVAWDQFSGVVFNKRIATFFESVFGKVRQHVESSESLFRDERFVSALLQTMQTAAKTHETEKIAALRNAVLNVALAQEQDAERETTFLALLDRFGPTHLTLLRFFQDPSRYFKLKNIPVPTVTVGTKLLAYQLISAAMPNLKEQVKSPLEDREGSSFQFIELILGELVSAKLIALENLEQTWTIPTWAVPKFDSSLATHLGRDFLTFITEPIAGKIREQ